MAFKFVTLQGKASWNSLQHIDKYGKWSIKLILDTPSLETFRELQGDGVLTRLNKDPDTQEWFVTLGRHQKKTYGSKEIIFTPPVVTERDGKVPFMGRIGHGSDVTVTCEVYPYTIPASGGKKGKALRLNSIRVDNLVPYNVQEHSDEREMKMIRGLSTTPPQAAY